MAVAAQAPVVYGEVTRFFPGETIVCIGTGPSLTKEDVEACHGRARIVAIKDAVFLAPWADVLYSGEHRWWEHFGPDLTFAGLRYTLHPKCGQWATVLQFGPAVGLSLDPRKLVNGGVSGYQAINLAVLLGAARIVLLGYDMTPGNYFGTKPYKAASHAANWAPSFPALVEPLRAVGVELVNASRRTALTCFPRVSLEEALA